MFLLMVAPTLRESLLAPFANPNLALLLLFAGVLLVYLEFNRPGLVIPGSLGAVFVLTAVYALSQLPIRPLGLLLILSALTLIILDLKFPTQGILTVGGIAAVYFGLLILIDSTRPELRIRPVLALALCTSFGVLTAILLRLALRARRQKALTGLAALVGFPAVTMEPIGAQPTGHILVQGEIWQAVAASPIAEQQPVMVTGSRDGVLEVEARLS